MQTRGRIISWETQKTATYQRNPTTKGLADLRRAAIGKVKRRVGIVGKVSAAFSCLFLRSQRLVVSWPAHVDLELFK